MGFFDRIKKIGIFNGFSQLDDDFYDELEESLILADMGMETTLQAVEMPFTEHVLLTVSF